MSLLNFPDYPFNGQIYPVVPLPNQTQYEWEAATSTWRIIRAGGGVERLIAGPNISLSPPEGVGVVTVSATGGGGGGTVTQVTGTLPIVVGGTTAFPVVSINPATTLSPGSLSAADKTKLDGLSNYTLPAATTATLGGVIPDGTTISVTPSGAISVINNSDWLLTGSNLAPTNRANAVQVGGTDVNPAINLAADGRIRTVQTGDVGNVSLAVGGQTYGLYNPDATSIAVSAGAVKKMQWDSVGVQLPGLANATQRTLYLNAAGYINAVDGLPGTVTEVTADLPLEVTFGDTTPNITVRSATTSARGVVQLNDTNTGESNTAQAATANMIWFLQQQINALANASNLTLAGLFDASTSRVTVTTPDGDTAGFIVNQDLPIAAPANKDYFVIITVGGTYDPPGGGGPYDTSKGDWFLSDGAEWLWLDVTDTSVSEVTATEPIVLTGNPSSPNITITEATQTDPGSMSAADKQRIDKTVVSDVDLVPGSDSIYNMVSLSQTAYDALSSKSFDTLYVILQCDLPPYGCRTDVNPYCVTDFTYAWDGCTELTFFPQLDTSSGIIFTRAWSYCWGLTSFPLIDTSKGTDFSFAWRNCYSLTSFPLIDTSNGTNFESAWDMDLLERAGDYSDLAFFPLLDVSKGTNFSFTWQKCDSLTSFPQLNMSSGLEFFQTWYGCTSLTSFPLLDVSSGVNFVGAWGNCTSLTSFPLLDTSKGTNFGSAWGNCNSLGSFPILNTSSGEGFFYAWSGCIGLTSFPSLDFSSGLYFNGAWYGCTNLVSFPANIFDTCMATAFEEAWQFCALNQTSVDNILVSINTAGQPNGILSIDGGTSSPPGPAGLAAKAALEARGWTVNTN
jgi:hypothetical protein